MGSLATLAVPQRRVLDAAADGPTNTVVSRTMADEAETYNSSVAGVDIHAVRAGPGSCPADVLAATSEQFTLTVSKVGFPMFSWTTVPDDMIVLSYMRAVPSGCRWCDIDLMPGSIVAYGPGAEHTARTLPGLGVLSLRRRCSERRVPVSRDR